MEDGPPPTDDRNGGHEPGTVYQPAAVAKRLGISAARLRRLGAAYERAVGELPRDDRGRLYPEEAVEQLERARAAVHAGRYTSIEQALGAGEAAARGDIPDTPAGRIQGRTEPLEELLRQLLEHSRPITSERAVYNVKESIEQDSSMRL